VPGLPGPLGGQGLLFFPGCLAAALQVSQAHAHRQRIAGGGEPVACCVCVVCPRVCACVMAGCACYFVCARVCPCVVRAVGCGCWSPPQPGGRSCAWRHPAGGRALSVPCPACPSPACANESARPAEQAHSCCNPTAEGAFQLAALQLWPPAKRRSTGSCAAGQLSPVPAHAAFIRATPSTIISALGTGQHDCVAARLRGRFDGQPGQVDWRQIGSPAAQTPRTGRQIRTAEMHGLQGLVQQDQQRQGHRRGQHCPEQKFKSP